MHNSIKNDIRNLFSGKGEAGFGTIIQSIANYLKERETSSDDAQRAKHFKKQEEEKLVLFINQHQLWYTVDFTQYVSEGAEQKVYLKDNKYVLKLNDAIYYTSWRDYFLNLLLHNYFFPDTAYRLVGFAKAENTLYAVVEQNFVTLTETTDLSCVKAFLLHNGFLNVRNNDYYNDELKIILEDLHDENVLTRNGILYFIDTVFYVMDASLYENDAL